MRDLYVEIIGQAQADKKIKMFSALNLGDNIGEQYITMVRREF
jgi:hypothetical protein